MSAAPHEEVPLRAICQRAGVQLPTLYYYFGSKQGLMDAVVSYAFDSYINNKSGRTRIADPIGALRKGWDNHVEFGLDNPSLYILMYGRVHPGAQPSAAQEVERLLLQRTTQAQEEGLLRPGMDPQEAAAHILSTNIGVTLFLITRPEPAMGSSLSRQVRDSVLCWLCPEA